MHIARTAALQPKSHAALRKRRRQIAPAKRVQRNRQRVRIFHFAAHDRMPPLVYQNFAAEDLLAGLFVFLQRRARIEKAMIRRNQHA